MRELLDKYRSGELNSDELRKLRERLESVTDEEADDLMPMDDVSQTSAGNYDAETLSRIKNEIDSRIFGDEDNNGERKGASVKFLRIFSAVAAVLVAVLLGTVIYLGLKLNPETGDMMATVSTTGSQKTVLTLPDGSVVTMRGGSRISYPEKFGSSERNVNFTGQGYFEVAKDTGHPFMINAGGFYVTVLGTSFSLRSNENSEDAEVILDSGSVSLKAEKSDESVRMDPGDVAVINKMTGLMTVTRKADAITADWAEDELVYNNVSPDSLIRSLETSYQITLSPAIKKSIRSNFTGTLPWNDLATTLKILSRIYGFELPY